MIPVRAICSLAGVVGGISGRAVSAHHEGNLEPACSVRDLWLLTRVLAVDVERHRESDRGL